MTLYLFDFLIYETLSNICIAWPNYRVLIATLYIEVFKFFVDKCFLNYDILQTYLRFIRGNVLMHVLYLFGVSIRKSALFDLRSPARTFLGLVIKVDPPSVNSAQLLERLTFCPVIFIFYKVRITTPWIFAFSGVSAVPDL